MSGRHRAPQPEGWIGRWALTTNITLQVITFLLLAAMATLTGEVEHPEPSAPAAVSAVSPRAEGEGRAR